MGIYTNISEVQKEIGYLHSKRTDILKEVNRVSTSVNGTTKDVFHKTVALYDEWDIVEYVYAVQAIGVKKGISSTSYVTAINSGSLGSDYGSISVFNDVGGSFGLEFHPKEDYVLVVWLLVYAKTSDNRLVSLPGIYSKVNSTLGDSWKDWYNATKPYLPHMLGVMSIENRTDLSSGQTAENTEIITNCMSRSIVKNNTSFEVSGTSLATLPVTYNILSNNRFGKYFTWSSYGMGHTENSGESTGTAMGPVTYNEKISAANIFVKPSGYVKCGDVTSRACFNYPAKDIVAKFKGKNIPVTIDLGKIIL